MKIVTAKQMAEIDETTINQYGIPSIVLMENAGERMFRQLLVDYPDINECNTQICILIGPGNNGGDGSVIARKLFGSGADPLAVLIGNPERLKGDAKINYDILIKLSVPVLVIQSSEDWQKYRVRILASSIIIDGLFGTGLTRSPSGIYGDIISDINTNYQNDVISIDIPSGLICTSDITGKQKDILAIIADKTYTVGLPKTGMLDFPGKDYTGSLTILDIGFPAKLLTQSKFHLNLLDNRLVSKLIPKRPSNSHKGTFGKLGVLVGSHQFSGAAILVCQAGYSVGAGLITLLSTTDTIRAVRISVPEVVFTPEISHSDIHLSIKDLDAINYILNNSHSLVLGPGLGDHPETVDLVKYVITNYKGNLLIDADGLNILSNQVDWLQDSNAEIILTPHMKEFSRLCQMSISDIQKDKVMAVSQFTKKFQCHVLLKDSVSMLCTPSQDVYYNSTGNCGLAKGGSGDVLSGVIAGLLVQGCSITNAGICGMYLHGKAADIAINQTTSYSLMPSSISQYIPHALNELINH